ncbi:hypothetical protein [Pseudarthrobacter enclensis]|uniref:hypothetical protein n=1 Tax=Pseudarthrobacter enclensis TaxID=993070 RepID=UPI003EE0747B
MLVTLMALCAVVACGRTGHPSAHNTPEVHPMQAAPVEDPAMIPVHASLHAGDPADECCCAQAQQPSVGIPPTQRQLPDDHANPGQAGITTTNAGLPPPGLSDRALKKREHPTPSLAALSVSRT